MRRGQSKEAVLELELRAFSAPPIGLSGPGGRYTRETVEIGLRPALALDLGDGRRDALLRSAESIHLWNDDGGNLFRFAALEARLSVLEAQVDRHRSVSRAA